MTKFLLDYVFPISVITPTPAASTAFLKQAIVVAKPKAGQEANVGSLYECATMTEVAVRTDNTNPQQLFNAGMSKVFILLANTLDLSEALNEHGPEAYTTLLTDDWDQDDLEATAATLVKAQLTFTAKDTGAAGNDISVEFLTGGTAGNESVSVVGKKISVTIESTVSTATQIKTKIDLSAAAMLLIDPVTIGGGGGATAQASFVEASLAGGDGFALGAWDGVLGMSFDDADEAAAFAAAENQVGFFHDAANGAKNMFFAFGKLLSNLSNWTNQQYIAMPVDDGVDQLGEANSLFDDKVSFVISDEEFSKRLALFAVGGKAIVAPYILKNVRIDLQSKSLQWISANQPDYTIKQAALLESHLQEEIINKRYVATNLISAGVISISLLQDNFVATGGINVAEPKALWRVFGEMRSTL
jgi:hypothetical protein